MEATFAAGFGEATFTSATGALALAEGLAATFGATLAVPFLETAALDVALGLVTAGGGAGSAFLARVVLGLDFASIGDASGVVSLDGFFEGMMSELRRQGRMRGRAEAGCAVGAPSLRNR